MSEVKPLSVINDATTNQASISSNHIKLVITSINQAPKIVIEAPN